MGDRNRFRRLAPVLVLGACILGSCSSGPEPVRPGTPAYFWAAVRAAWQAKDYVKANENLNQLVGGDSEFAAKARALQLVAASGLAEGYSDLADAYENGSHFTRTEQSGFRDQVRVARAAASQLSLQAAEAFRKFLDTDKNATVPLAFAPPQPGDPQAALMTKLGKGMLLKGAEADTLQESMLLRGVSRAGARIPDASKQEVPREQFLMAAATSMVELSRLYGTKKLDQPQRLTALCGLAQEALRLVPASPKTKELQGKIQELTKKTRPS